MFSAIKPFQYVAIRLPSDNIKIEQITPNTNINLGKFGIFNSNALIGRPFHLTFEVLDKAEQINGRQLRVVKAAELHAATLIEEAESDLPEGTTPNPELDEYGLISTEKSNVAIFDNPDNQKLTFSEIEALKADEAGSAKELIARILASHSQLDQKTAFSLAKYTLRKQKKYIKRFTVLPLDVATVVDWYMGDKDFARIMEIRNEALGLLGSWANVHAAEKVHESGETEEEAQCRYLVVDDTGGLVVAALAERMGILFNTALSISSLDQSTESIEASADTNETNNLQQADTQSTRSTPLRRHRQAYHTSLATSNTLTVVHSNQQPNLSLLRYFNFDINVQPPSSSPDPHPLHNHLKTLSWLQLTDPSADTTYNEPTAKTPEELRAMKSNSRSTYWRKRRRWERCKAIVDETRAGGFNGLIVASYTNPLSILKQLVPLLAGGAQIAVYAPHIESLLPVADAYSTARRSAFLSRDEDERESLIGSQDFPVDPTLALGFMVQTARVRKWQVLPGRTHPLMMGKGGAEGYIASATRVIPVKGKVEARGKQGRSRPRPKRKIEDDKDRIDLVEVDVDVDSSDEAERQAELSGNDRKKAKVQDEEDAIAEEI